MIRLLRSGAAALVVVGALGACSNGDADAGTTATLGTAPTTSTTATDPYAIPETIDAAYVERVLDKLAEVIGDADRIALRERNVPPEVHDRINAVYGDEFALLIINSHLEDAAMGFQGILDPPGNAVFTVKDILRADSECVIASVETDASAILVDPLPPAPDTMVLRRTDESDDPQSHNPTPWAIYNHTNDVIDLQQENPCEQ